jgi:hypothetical protein
MKNARPFSIALITLVTACVSTNVDVPRDHPANPSAPVTQVALTPTLGTTASTGESNAPAAHQHAGHEQHGPTPAPSGSTPPAATAAPIPPTGATPAATKQAEKPAAEIWTCPMHPEIAKSGPGQCPICGMNLLKRAPGKAK